jgi:hypothetical protein
MENQNNQPKAQYAPSQGLRLDTIAEDVQHIIAAELNILSPPSILAMAQSSQMLRQVALPLVYQDVVLHREDDETRTPQAYGALVGLFRGGKEGSIARHVRHLVVKDELPTDDLTMILDTISKFGVLRKLRSVVTMRSSTDLAMLMSIVGKPPLICHHQCLTSYIRLGQISNCLFAYLVAGMQRKAVIDKWTRNFSPPLF